jgi:hypothetical protein
MYLMQCDWGAYVEKGIYVNAYSDICWWISIDQRIKLKQFIIIMFDSFYKLSLYNCTRSIPKTPKVLTNYIERALRNMCA